MSSFFQLQLSRLVLFPPSVSRAQSCSTDDDEMQCDRACESFAIVRNTAERMAIERETFFVGLGIDASDNTLWLPRLVSVATSMNEAYIVRLRAELSTAHQHVQEVDIIDILRQEFVRIVRVANGLRRDLSEMVQCYQRNRYKLSQPQQASLRLQLDYVRNGVSICVTQEREARAKFSQIEPLFEFLTLPEGAFQQSIHSISPYSPGSAINGRLAGLVNGLQEVITECSTTQAEKVMLLKHYNILCQNIQDHAALQSKSLATIQMELDAAGSVPSALHHGSHILMFSDLIGALPASRCLLGDLETIWLQETELRESLTAASEELLAAIRPTGSM